MKHERVHCSIVHGREIKYFSEYSNLLCRCRAAPLFEARLGAFFFLRIFARTMQMLALPRPPRPLHRPPSELPPPPLESVGTHHPRTCCVVSTPSAMHLSTSFLLSTRIHNFIKGLGKSGQLTCSLPSYGGVFPGAATTSRAQHVSSVTAVERFISEIGA